MFDINAANNTCMNCFKQHTGSVNPCPDCGYNEHSADMSPHLLKPRTILNGKYLVGKVLGQGGFGITYVGWDINLGLRIALKEYYPSGFVTRETTSTSAATVQPFTGSEGDFFLKGREKFINEARSLAKFFALPGIVSVKDYFLENGTAYITMEFIDGQTLKDYVANMGGKLVVNQVFDLMKPVMSSLAEVHKAGIIHRDISPDNIMISKEGYLKLLDFGAARDYTQAGAKSMSVMLKPGFAPEEQYRTKGDQGPWTDIYALCATMYRCITGSTPEESIERVRRDNVLPPSALGISIDPKKETALMMGMAVMQNKRFQSIPAIYSAMYGVPLSGTTSLPAPQVASPQNVAIPSQQPATPQQYGAPPPAAGPPQQYHPQAAPPQHGAPPPAAGPPPQYRPQATPPQNMAPPPQVAIPQGFPPQKSGSWLSNNKALAGVLAGVIALVLILGVILLVVFLPGGNNDRISATPSPTPRTTSPTPTPTPTPTPNLTASLNNTTWDLYELDTAGIIFNSDDLISLGSVFNMWFDGNGDFAGDFHAGGLLFGTWRLSGSLIYVDIDGELDILTLEDNKITLTIEGMIATFIRNDRVSFNPPDRYAPPPPGNSNISYEDHPIVGTWFIYGDRHPWLYHIGRSWQLIFFSNGSVYCSGDVDSPDDENWAYWYIDDETNIRIEPAGYSRFRVVVRGDILTITDEAGDSAEYYRYSHSSPVGYWIYDNSSDYFPFFGRTGAVWFDVYFDVYSSGTDRYGSWWIDPEDDLLVILDTNIYETYYFEWYYVADDYLTIFDYKWDYITFKRG